jgi:hypothetical protein
MLLAVLRHPVIPVTADLTAFISGVVRPRGPHEAPTLNVAPDNLSHGTFTLVGGYAPTTVAEDGAVRPTACFQPLSRR